MRSFKEAIRPLWPLLAFMVLLLLWPFISPNDIMEKDPRILFMLSGTIFSNISVSLGQLFSLSYYYCESFSFSPVRSDIETGIRHESSLVLKKALI